MSKGILKILRFTETQRLKVVLSTNAYNPIIYKELYNYTWSLLLPMSVLQVCYKLQSPSSKNPKDKNLHACAEQLNFKCNINTVKQQMDGVNRRH